MTNIFLNLLLLFNVQQSIAMEEQEAAFVENRKRTYQQAFYGQEKSRDNKDLDRQSKKHCPDSSSYHQATSFLTSLKSEAKPALKIFEKEAEAGNQDALYSLAKFYLKGQWVKKNEFLATRLFEKAADRGHAGALYQLGKISDSKALSTSRENREYYRSASTSQKIHELYFQAHNYFLRAADKGHFKATMKLVGIYISKNEIHKAEEAYEQAIKVANETDSADVFYQLGMNARIINLLSSNRNLEARNYPALAHTYLLKAVAKDHVEAMLELARFYLRGEYKNIGKAEELYKKVAEQGHSQAARELAEFYHKGEVFPQDAQKAMEIYQMLLSKEPSYSFSHTCDTALSYLGYYYYYGVPGIPQDFRKSAECWARLMSEGDQTGLNALVEMYEEGKGVPQDLAKAAQYEKNIEDEDD